MYRNNRTENQQSVLGLEPGLRGRDLRETTDTIGRKSIIHPIEHRKQLALSWIDESVWLHANAGHARFFCLHVHVCCGLLILLVLFNDNKKTRRIFKNRMSRRILAGLYRRNNTILPLNVLYRPTGALCALLAADEPITYREVQSARS